MAKTYGMLPSEVEARATSFDIMVTDVYTTWEKHQMDKASGRASLDNYNPDDLKELMERTRNGG